MSAAVAPAPALAPPRRAWLTDLPVLAVAVVWGASYLAAKGITTTHTVIAVLVLRFAVVLPVLVATGWRKLRALSGAQWRGAGLLGLVLSGIFLLETYGVVHTSATNAGLIISLTMFFTPLAEAAVTRVRPPASFVAAAGLSVAGVILLTQGGGFTSPSAGDLLMLLAALARTVHVMAMARIKAVQSADSLSLTTVQLGSAVAVFAVLAALPGTGASPWSVAADFGPGDTGEGERPQPTLTTLDALIDESRQAGMKVTVDQRVAAPGDAPAATGRTVYRIAQECLTNARKHAPGTEVTVTVTGGPGDGLTIEVANPAPTEPYERVPGSGQGLIGLTERATLAGGRLEHGPTPDGGFAVRARLPWPAA